MWEELEPGTLAKKQVPRGRCKEWSLDVGQGGADSSGADHVPLGPGGEGGGALGLQGVALQTDLELGI